MPRLHFIAAVTPEFGIGFKQNLPWFPSRLSLDLGFLSFITSLPIISWPTAFLDALNLSKNEHDPITIINEDQNAVIMGRLTWESLPPSMQPLKGRLNVVITSNQSYSSQVPKGVLVFSNLSQAVDYLEQSYPCFRHTPSTPLSNCREIFIVGGAQMYNEVLKRHDLGVGFITMVEKLKRNQEESTFPVDVYFPKSNLHEKLPSKLNITGEVFQWVKSLKPLGNWAQIQLVKDSKNDVLAIIEKELQCAFWLFNKEI